MIADEAEAQGEASIERAAPGSYTVDTNGYFTITNSPTYPDCKVIMRGKWIPLLGRDLRSKTLTIREFDESEQEPFRTLLCLRAWMCQRADRKVFVDGHAARRRWLSREVQSLAADIAKLGVPGGGVGSEKADWLIWSWCPTALPPEFIAE